MSWTFRPALLLTTGRTLGFAATFFIPVILVRIFDQSEFGTYKQVFLILTTLTLIAQFGMAESLFYFLPASRQKGGRYLCNAIIVLTLAGLSCWILLAAAAAKIAGLLNNRALADYLPLLGLYILFMMISSVMEITLISRKRYRPAALAYLFSDLIRAMLFVAPVLLAPAMRWLLVGAVIFAVIRFVATVVYVRWEYGGEFVPDLKCFKRQVAYALPFGMAGLLAIVETKYHQYAVAHFFDPAVFAIYSIGCLQIPLVEFLTNSTGNLVMVGMKEAVDQGDQSAALAIWHDATRKLALLLFPFVGVLLLVAPELITFLFTEKFSASVPIFIIWMGVMVLGVLQTDAVLRVYAETRFLFFLYAIKLSLVIALLPWLLEVFYLQGAVLATLVAILAAKAAALIRMKKLMKMPVSRLLPWGGLPAIGLCAATSGFLVAAVKSFFELPNVLVLIAASSVYGLSYLALLFGFGLISEGERSALAGWLRPSRWRTPSQETSAGGGT